MQIIKSAQAVDQATCVALATKARNQMKASPIRQGNNDSRKLENVGGYGNVTATTADRGRIINVFFYKKFSDTKPTDSAIIKFDSPAW